MKIKLFLSSASPGFVSSTKLLSLAFLACLLCSAKNVCAQSAYAGTYAGTYSGPVTKESFCPTYSEATIQNVGTWTMTVGTDASIQTSWVEDSLVDGLNGYATRIDWDYDPVNHHVSDAGLFSQQFEGRLGSSQNITISNGAIASDGTVTGFVGIGWWDSADYCVHLDQYGQVQNISLVGSRSGTTGPPIVTTNAATNVASFSATLNGTVIPHGLTTTVYFQYGTTTSYGSTTASHSFSGSTYQNVSANISGLSASTTYHFRIVAHNSRGTTYGSDRTFTTLSATGPPVVATNPATLIASFSATLNGTVDPHGLTTTVYFQYGTTTSYGSTTSAQTKTGNTYQSVSANISSLAANTTYHFRVVATNSTGTTYGGHRTFTTLSATGPPVVNTNPATLIVSFSATLNGTVDPHGLTTTAYFQYGTTTSYGLTTPPQSKSGNTYQNISANISGLTASTIYHFRIVATNSAGTRYGADRTFRTLSATGPPVVITNPATNVASSSATLNGAVDPHGLSTSVRFQYGTTTSYGLSTPNQSKTGNTYQNVTANVSGLSASTTYHFRIVATNSAGTRYGGDRAFNTP
jgi:hypothetical protein